MFCMQDRRMRNIIDNHAWLGNGIRARKMAEGRCVNTMVLMSPMRLESEDAARFEMEEMMFVVKKRVPS